MQMNLSDCALNLVPNTASSILPEPDAQAANLDIPFLIELGVDVLSAAQGHAQVALTLDRRHLNSRQVAHGGIVMTLLDTVMSMAGRSLDPKARPGVTVDMKTSFMRPAGQAGTRILAKGKALHRSTTMVFCEAELWNGDQLVAKAMGTFKYPKRETALR